MLAVALAVLVLQAGGALAAARWPLRGHQLSAAHHPAMFRTWDELGQFARELAAFGTNQLELAHLDSLDPGTASSLLLVRRIDSMTNHAQ